VSLTLAMTLSKMTSTHLLKRDMMIPNVQYFECISKRSSEAVLSSLNRGSEALRMTAFPIAMAASKVRNRSRQKASAIAMYPRQLTATLMTLVLIKNFLIFIHYVLLSPSSSHLLGEETGCIRTFSIRSQPADLSL
jgi:hypothetical protein